VQALLDAGASFVGKTHLDELAYSTNGVNHHYGAPLNTIAPTRVTGGSSSGSASAVAANLADIGLGSDTGGSVRLPASYCGLYGIRPTHGAISLEGAMPLAPSFDTVGWLTRTPDLLRKIGDVLLPPDKPQSDLRRLLIAGDAFELLTQDVQAAFAPVLDRIRAGVQRTGTVALYPEGALDPRPVHITAQAFEAWSNHRHWHERHAPEIGPNIALRFDFAKGVTRQQYNEANRSRVTIGRMLDDLLGRDGMLLMPTTFGIAPLRSASPNDFEEARHNALLFLSFASITGRPQISIPATSLNGAPLGLSILGRRGADRSLLGWSQLISDIL
jgi:amidase